MAEIKQFSIPVYTNLLEFNIKEIVDNLENEPLNLTEQSEEHGSKSINTYILNNKKYAKLKKWINDEINHYCTEYLGWEFKSMTITQSWVSCKEFGQKHILHKHPNSLVSGVFYWDDNIGSMYLKRPSLPINYEIAIAKYNEYSNDWIEIKPKKGLLCLFPSYLEHFVDKNTSTKLPRKCMPLNSMLFEILGYEGNLTELNLQNNILK